MHSSENIVPCRSHLVLLIRNRLRCQLLEEISQIIKRDIPIDRWLCFLLIQSQLSYIRIIENALHRLYLGQKPAAYRVVYRANLMWRDRLEDGDVRLCPRRKSETMYSVDRLKVVCCVV